MEKEVDLEIFSKAEPVVSFILFYGLLWVVFIFLFKFSIEIKGINILYFLFFVLSGLYVVVRMSIYDKIQREIQDEFSIYKIPLKFLHKIWKKLNKEKDI